MNEEKPFVAIIGRFTPIGGFMYHENRERTGGCDIAPNGTPLCQKVKLERIVPVADADETELP